MSDEIIAQIEQELERLGPRRQEARQAVREARSRLDAIEAEAEALHTAKAALRGTLAHRTAALKPRPRRPPKVQADVRELVVERLREMSPVREDRLRKEIGVSDYIMRNAARELVAEGMITRERVPRDEGETNTGGAVVKLTLIK